MAGDTPIVEVSALKGRNIDRLREAIRERFAPPKVDTTPELREHLGGREDAGVLVGKVLEGSAAEKAGVKVGDLLISIGGDAVETPGEVVRAVGRNAGKTITIEVVRNGRAQTLSVTLPEEEEAGSPVRPRARVVAPKAPPVHPARMVDRRMA